MQAQKNTPVKLFQYLVDIFYRYPKSNLKKFERFGGYINYRKMVANSKLMEKAAFHLPPVKSDVNGLPIYFLTGQKYLYQTLFCIRSLTKVCKEQFRFMIVDDGSFDVNMINQINKLLPGAEIITRAAINKNLDKMLPRDKYPVLRNKREVYPHLKKLTDIHTIPGNPWKLVLDSDMLFWNDPTEMVAWLKPAEQPLHMLDCAESYGYSATLMESLTGTSIKPLVNVGAIGFNSGAIDWDKLEFWTKELEAREGTTYYLEQALTAMLLADTNCLVLKANEYIVNPDKGSVTNNKGVLHHYVDLSKEWYFKDAWKKLI